MWNPTECLHVPSFCSEFIVIPNEITSHHSERATMPYDKFFFSCVCVSIRVCFWKKHDIACLIGFQHNPLRKSFHTQEIVFFFVKKILGSNHPNTKSMTHWGSLWARTLLGPLKTSRWSFYTPLKSLSKRGGWNPPVDNDTGRDPLTYISETLMIRP